MKTIVWDVDDVLNDLMRDWLTQWWMPAHPETKIDYEKIAENPPHRILNIRREEYLQSLDAFRLAEGANMQPVPEALDWFRNHGHRFRHIALTAVPLFAADISAAWVMKHFGEWIRSFNVIPSARENDSSPVYDQTKADYLKWWGRADIFVDDNTENIEGAAAIGIQTVMMPRPWNRNLHSIADAFELVGKVVKRENVPVEGHTNIQS